LKSAVLGAAAGVSAGIALVVRTTLRAPVFDSHSGSAAPWLVSSVPPLLLALIAVVLSGVLGVFLARRGREDLLTPFLPCGLAAGIFLPGAFAEAPFLAAFAGRSLDLLLVVGLAISLSRLARGLPSVAASGRTIGLAGFVLYLGVGYWISSKVGLSGDEPHYLLITYSLLNDLDLEVQNNYGAEDYRSFYQGKMEPRLATGTPYSVHGIGVPVLLAPGFAALGLFGVLLTEALISALLLHAIYQASLRITASPSASLFAVAGFGLTSPALFLSVSAYPELPAALVAALAVGRLLDPEPPRAFAAFAWTLVLGALPFLHVKFLPLGGLLIAAFAYQFGRRARSSLAWLSAGAAVSVGSFLLVTFLTLGSFDPTASYGRQRIFLERVPLGIAGLLFDQEYGLLLHAPIYLLGFAGIVSLFRRNALLGAVSFLALLSVAIPGAAHPLWSGGTSPPARFLFPALPLMTLAAAALLGRERESGVGPWAPWLLASSVALGLSMVFLPGGPFFLNSRDGTGRIWEALSTSWNLSDYLPSLVRADPRSLASAAGLFLLVLLAIGAQIRRARGFRVAPLFGALLLAAWAHDRTFVSRSRELEPHSVSRVMHHLSRRDQDRFLALPSFERLSREALTARVSLPLEAVSDGDPRHWWSRAYSLPAGRFRLSGAPPIGITFYNGESAFQSDALTFSSEVALGRFRLRARNLFEPPRVFLLEARPSLIEGLEALSTIPATGLRLHALDDEVYLDLGGFWIRKASRASFAIEVEARRTREVRIQITNGGAPNRVSVDSALVNESYRLAPWEEREIRLTLQGPLVAFAIGSESGFRPSELDPSSRDDRELGALVSPRPAFD
jgi:hypothetical protein